MMRAMTLRAIGRPLVMEERAKPKPGPREILIRVEACGVCRTDLHVVDGELPDPKVPIVPGHEVVGFVERLGAAVETLSIGERVGAPWLAHTCGHCFYCDSGRENLCDHSDFTGYTRDGGYASHMIADADFVLKLPRDGDPVATAPLLCAGLIGWRCLGGGRGAPGRALWFRRRRPYRGSDLPLSEARGLRLHAAGRRRGAGFRALAGRRWAGGSDEAPPEALDAAILFAPVGALVPTALRAVRKGGRVVCGGIHMSDIPSFPYAWLWGEREVVSVANLTRRDGVEFFEIADRAGVRTSTKRYDLADANRALDDLREGRLQGAAVLTP